MKKYPKLHIARYYYNDITGWTWGIWWSRDHCRQGYLPIYISIMFISVYAWLKSNR